MSNKLTKGGIVLKKQEMTQVWIDDKLVPVTILRLVPQEVVRHKIFEKDWYNAILVWADKKEFNKEKGIKIKYKYSTEFKVSEDLFEKFPVWTVLTTDILEGVEKVSITWKSKGKWFQWVIRRFGFAGGRATHGSQFHRHPGSIGNMKPRRVNKWHPLPGHMGLETVTIHNIPVVDIIKDEWEELVLLKGSVPGARNSYIKLFVR